jgi:hypothetical protein
VNWNFHVDKSAVPQGSLTYYDSIGVDLAARTYTDFKGNRIALPITMRQITEFPVPANSALQPTR